MRFDLRNLRLLRGHDRLERALLEKVEERSFLDIRALDEKPLLDERRHPGDDVDALLRLDASDELLRLGDRLLARGDDADDGGARRLGLRERRRNGGRARGGERCGGHPDPEREHAGHRHVRLRGFDALSFDEPVSTSPECALDVIFP
ncbi:hypothetical protein J2W80_004927 [Methylorubrum extorquens]|nr:hypothetical protein [Methylorubrum extorquens]